MDPPLPLSCQASTSSSPDHGEEAPPPPPKFSPTSLLPLPPVAPPSGEDVPIISCPCPYNLAVVSSFVPPFNIIFLRAEASRLGSKKSLSSFGIELTSSSSFPLFSSSQPCPAQSSTLKSTRTSSCEQRSSQKLPSSPPHLLSHQGHQKSQASSPFDKSIVGSSLVNRNETFL